MGSTKSTPPTDRQAKIRAASSGAGSGANKIVVGAVVLVVAIVAVVGGVIWSQRSAATAPRTAPRCPKGVAAMGEGYRAFADVTPQPGRPDGRPLRGLPVPGVQAVRGAHRLDGHLRSRRRARSC